FIGIGLTEQELNDTLQYFVSNVPIRRPAPIFVIWNRPDEKIPQDEKTDSERNERRRKENGEWKQYKKDRRLDFLIRLGVHLLFDADIDLDRKDFDEESIERLSPLEALPKALSRMPDMAKRIDSRATRIPDIWRSVQARLMKVSRNPVEIPHRMWGAVGLK